MRFHITLLTLLGTINMITALAVFTTPEVDTTSAHQDRPQVPSPQPPARFKQATRAGIVARQAQGPAKRQNSATPICNRPATGNTPYAIFTDAFFFTDKQIGQAYAASLQQCYVDCEVNPTCVAVTYVTTAAAASTACRPIFQRTGMSTFGNGQSLNGGAQGEAKGLTCAQVKAIYPNAAGWNCCNARRA